MQVAAGSEDLEFLNNFQPFTSGTTLICPVIDRFSPPGFAIAKYIHDNVYPHRGYESSFRLSMDYVYILEGLKSFREIGEECVTCKKLRGKYLAIAFGPLPPENFTLAPVFYVCQLDIFGPCHVYVPGHSMNLRNKKVLESKYYVSVFARPISKCVNLQVTENKAADGIIDGINRYVMKWVSQK